MTWCQHQTALSSRTTAPLAATTVAVVVTMVTASSSQTPRRRHDPCVTLLGWMLEGKAALAMCVLLLLLLLRVLRRLPTHIACDVCSRLAACCGVCVCLCVIRMHGEPSSPHPSAVERSARCPRTRSSCCVGTRRRPR